MAYRCVFGAYARGLRGVRYGWLVAKREWSRAKARDEPPMGGDRGEWHDPKRDGLLPEASTRLIPGTASKNRVSNTTKRYLLVYILCDLNKAQ